MWVALGSGWPILYGRTSLRVHDVRLKAQHPWAMSLLGHEAMLCPWFGPNLDPLSFMCISEPMGFFLGL